MSGIIFRFWDRIRSGFWFIPAVMAGGAVVLALLSVFVDEAVTSWLSGHLGWTFSGGAEGASAVLGVVAGSMIAIAGVVFSMTLLALSMTSSQLGPRLLRSFMRDKPTQVVLGTFIATFLYCLFVLRTVRRPEESVFVPHLSVSLGVLLAVVSVGVFIYFIHHVAVSIQANEVAARVGKELISGIDRLFPKASVPGASKNPPDSPERLRFEAFGDDAGPVASKGDGYLQFVDETALLALAMEEDLVIRLEHKPGSYVVAGCSLATVQPARRLSEDLVEQIHSMFVLGHQRTSVQDIEFGVNQLVEVAVRALSPGVADPFTAMTCVDHLGSALCRLASREMPSSFRYDRQNQLRVIAPADTFSGIVDSAFNQIRQYARSSTAVTLRLLETIAVVAEFSERTEDRTTLLRHADMIVHGAADGLPEEQDRRAVEERFSVVRARCNRSS